MALENGLSRPILFPARLRRPPGRRVPMVGGRCTPGCLAPEVAAAQGVGRVLRGVRATVGPPRRVAAGGSPRGKVKDPHPRERGGGAMGEEALPRLLVGPVELEGAPYRAGRVVARLGLVGAVEVRPGRVDPGLPGRLGRRGRRTRGGCRS